MRLAAAQQNPFLSRWTLQSELVKRHALAPRLDDARSRGGGESQRAHGELGHLQETHVVGDCADHNSHLVLTALPSHELGHALDGDWCSVCLRSKQPLQHSLVELGVRTAREEAVQLDEQP